MPKYEVTAPDGRKFEVTAPDGATQEQVLAFAQQQFAAKPAMTVDKPAVVSAGETMMGIPRQIGLAARYLPEGLAQVAEIGTEPIRRMVVNPMLRAAGMGEVGRLSEGVSAGLDAIGLPKPEGANERVIADASRMVAGAGGMARGAQVASNVLTNTAGKVAQSLGSNVGQQAIGAAGAGGAGGSVREAGGGPWEQFTAALIAGLATPAAANALTSAATKGANAIARAVTPQTVVDQRVDQQITLALQKSGLDWSQVPERLRQGLRAEVAQALNTGQPLNADAMRRLLVMRRAGVEPTVGQLTQDPGQITREANLAKTGANSTDPALQVLPGLQNKNTQTLLTNLDAAGARNAPTAMEAGAGVVQRLQGNLASAEAARDALYAAARDSQGRAVVLDGPAAAQAAIRRLQADNVGKLPAEVDDILNKLTNGSTPLTVDYQQQLVKNLYRKMQGTQDGDLRHGLRIVREAIDNADIPATRAVNPGNLPAVPGTVPPSTQQAGQEAVDAFRRARTAHRELMARIDANPALRAVADGVEPDQFVQRFVIGSGATARDVQALRSELGPETTQQMRQYLVRYLKDRATGGDEDVTKFAGKTYRDAFRALEAKLPAFFSREEIQQLRDIGDAAKYMQAQPAGAAVNNSNSGALVLGRGLDTLDRIAAYVPFGVKDVVRGSIQGVQQRQVMTPANALRTLAAPQAKPNPLLALPLVAAGQRAEDR